MNDLFKDVLMVIGSYVAVLALSFLGINVLTLGFLSRFLKVRASMGRLVLVKVLSNTDRYYKVGKVSEGFLVYKARGVKEEKRLAVPEGCIYRSMGVWCVDVDEETNELVVVRERLSGFDAEKYEQLYLRALYKPSLMNRNEKIVFIMLGVLILGIIVLFFFVKGIDDRTLVIAEQLKSLVAVGSSTGVVN